MGLTVEAKVRHAIVGLGDGSRETMLPGAKRTGNSQVTAFVSDDEENARLVGAQQGVAESYGFDQYEGMLRSGLVDALYPATPHWCHAEFVIPVLEAGITCWWRSRRTSPRSGRRRSWRRRGRWSLSSAPDASTWRTEGRSLFGHLVPELVNASNPAKG